MKRFEHGLLIFVVGLCLALLPVPTLVITGLYSAVKSKVFKPNLLLLAGSLLWICPLIITRTPMTVLLAEVAQVLLLVVLGGTNFFYLSNTGRFALSSGLVLGGFSLLVFSVSQTLIYGEHRVQGWVSHPNVWAMQMVSITLLQHLLVQPLLREFLSNARAHRSLVIWTSILSLLSCFGVVLLSGSRAALLSYLVGLGLLGFLTLPKTIALRISLLGVGLLLCLGLLLPSWRQRVSQTLTLFQEPTVSRNLFISSENLFDGLWQPQQVTVQPVLSTSVPGEWSLVKTAVDSWSRLQQQVILFPATQYSLHAEFLARTQNAGFWGVGSNATEQAELIVNLQGQIQAKGVEVLKVKVLELENGWQRLEATFIYTGQFPLRWWLGPTPEQSKQLAEVRVRALQFEHGHVSPYEATYPTAMAASNAQTRLPTFRTAWAGFREQPWWGQGINAFASYYLANPPGQNPFVAGHAHNLLLQTLFERGLIGGTSLIVISAALILLAQKQAAFIMFFVAIMVANLFDYTVWGAASFYLLAASTQLFADPKNTTKMHIHQS